MPAGTCGKLGVFDDDFADGTPRDVWTVANAAGVVEANGTLALTPNGVATGYTSRTKADLRGTAIAIEVPAMLDVAGDGIATFALRTGTGAVGFTQQMGTLRRDRWLGSADARDAAVRRRGPPVVADR